MCGNTEIVKFLLGLGIDVNHKDNREKEKLMGFMH